MPLLAVRMTWSTSYLCGTSDTQPPGGGAWSRSYSPALLVKQELYQEGLIGDLLSNSLILQYVSLPYAGTHTMRLDDAL